jgi:hypothetical protein
MKSAAVNKPSHVVKGNVFDALGFSASEARAEDRQVSRSQLEYIDLRYKVLPCMSWF